MRQDIKVSLTVGRGALTLWPSIAVRKPDALMPTLPSWSRDQSPDPRPCDELADQDSSCKRRTCCTYGL